MCKTPNAVNSRERETEVGRKGWREGQVGKDVAMEEESLTIAPMGVKFGTK